MNEVSTKMQVSAGGVAFRQHNGRTEIALIAVGDDQRWQLPKGLVNSDETHEATAQREVGEEAGVDTELIGLIDKIEYWYYSKNRGGRVRFHKFVYFYLMRYLSGDVQDHDQEVNEARWVEIEEAEKMLTFKSEQKVVSKAREMIQALAQAGRLWES